MKPLRRPALLFIAIGLLLYAALYAGAEALLMHKGHSHPLYKLARLQEHQVSADVQARAADWLVLGASHAMPLGFAPITEHIQQRSGLRLLVLAGPGTGPTYNRFVFEQFLQHHRAIGLLYVVDSFSFYSRTWNQDRFADRKLLSRTPWRLDTAAALARYVLDSDMQPDVLLDYVTGFSKINHRDRWQRDVWDGETQFERVAKPSKSALQKRIDYLYAGATPSGAMLDRYLQDLTATLALAQQHGMQVQVVKMPLPSAFLRLLPEEPAFDAKLRAILAPQQIKLRDFSATVPDAQHYFDTDHLNRQGMIDFLDQSLLPLLLGQGG